MQAQLESSSIYNDHEYYEPYENCILSEYAWFKGPMDRVRAQALLEHEEHGTFLVRVSSEHDGNQHYVISLNHHQNVKHIRIYTNSSNNLYFLSKIRYFKSIIELITWYENNNLAEVFHMLDAKLAIPLTEISLYNEHDYYEAYCETHCALDDYNWFKGPMDRLEAQTLLEREDHGTFLVRVSFKYNGTYVISLNHHQNVKHMRIYVNNNLYFLSHVRYFKSVVDLINWYQNNNLIEVFHMLDAKLASPLKQ